MMKGILFILSIIMIFSLLSCRGKNTLTQEEAGKIAYKKLETYAKEEQIPISIIKPSSLQHNQYYKNEKLCAFYYISETKPPRLIYIYVDHFGNAELHYQIESNK